MPRPKYQYLEEEVDFIDIPSYLASETLEPKFYHKCSKTGIERAAIGSIETLKTIPKIKNSDSRSCFYGGVFFNKSSTSKKDSLWKDFPSCIFFLPLLEIIQDKEQTKIIHRFIKKRHYPSFIKTSAEELRDPPNLQKNIPEKEGWKSSVDEVLHTIKTKKIQKVVLARRSNFSIPSTTDFFYYLKKLLYKCPNTTTFAFQTKPSSLFLGSTPEKLYHRIKNQIQIDAIAGTKKRGSTPEDDAALKRELKQGNKENQEIRLVTEFLLKKLKPLCENIELKTPLPDVIETDTVQHLYQNIKGSLKAHIKDWDIIKSLHPTPAVNGTPQLKAQKTIEKLEPFSRGFYAGQIGWVSQKTAYFSVSIRSALLKQNHLYAFSGAGIVEGSNANMEWDELNHKISHWKNL